jgi:hypothetical protein
VVCFATDVRAVDLLAVEQHDHRVLELHARHFACHRHVADGQLVFAVGREVVLDVEAAACPERHPLETVLLAAGSGRGARRQRNHHVLDVAVGRRDRRSLRVANRLDGHRARGEDVLVDEVRRHLQRGGVVVEVALQVVVGQQGPCIDVQPEQVADGVLVLAPIQAAQRHASGRRSRVGRGVNLLFQPGDERRDRLIVRALRAGGRHQATAQLANHLLSNLRMLRCAQIQPAQHQTALLRAVVVAAKAELIDYCALRRRASLYTGRLRVGLFARRSALREGGRLPSRHTNACRSEVRHYGHHRDTQSESAPHSCRQLSH